MGLLPTIAICLAIIYGSSCMPGDEPTFVTRKHNPDEIIKFEDVVGHDFSHYYYGSDHIFMGNNAKIYVAYSQNDRVEYDLLKNSDVLPDLMNVTAGPVNVPQESRKKKTRPVQNPNKKPVNYTAYVRLVIVTDYSIYKQHNGDVKKIVDYVRKFWTGVDLVFRQQRRPEIRLNIAGIIIATDDYATSYDVRFFFGLFTDADDSLLSLSKLWIDHLFENQQFVTVAMTNKHMTDGRFANVHGIAYEGAACSTNFARMIVRDLGSYTGITTAVHELAHLFDAPHDDVLSGFAMDGTMQTYRGFFWANRLTLSYYTKKNISDYFTRGGGRCYMPKPDVGIPIKIKLPGIGTSRDEQCQAVYGSSALADPRMSGREGCENLWCINKYLFGLIQFYEKSFHAPAEGTKCDNGTSPKVCLKRVCVNIPEELKSDYS